MDESDDAGKGKPDGDKKASAAASMSLGGAKDGKDSGSKGGDNDEDILMEQQKDKERKLFVSENSFTPSGSAFYSVVPNVRSLKAEIAKSRKAGKEVSASDVTRLFLDKSPVLESLVRKEYNGGERRCCCVLCCVLVRLILCDSARRKVLNPRFVCSSLSAQTTIRCWASCSLRTWPF